MMHEPESDGATKSGTHAGKRMSALRRFGPLAALAAAAAAFFALGLQDYLSIEALQEHYATLRSFVAENFALAAAAYVALYAAAIAASVPGGLVLTVTGGLLFGALAGTALAVIGATLGATGIFLVARTALGDFLEKRTRGAMARMADGFRENAFNYLLVLRLVPLFPFFVVNLAPAFLGVPLRTYVLATFIGIIPGTFVYSSVGAGLGSVVERGGEFSIGGVLTPQVVVALIGLAALALLPIVYKRFKARRSEPLPR